MTTLNSTPSERASGLYTAQKGLTPYDKENRKKTIKRAIENLNDSIQDARNHLKIFQTDAYRSYSDFEESKRVYREACNQVECAKANIKTLEDELERFEDALFVLDGEAQ